MSLSNLKAMLAARAQALGLRPYDASATSDELTPALSGANGGLLVELYNAAGAIATSALQSAANALLGYIAPGTHTVLLDTLIASADYEPGVDFTVVVGVAGVLQVKTAAGEQLLLTAPVDGYVHPCLLSRVYKSASNTATNVMAVY